MTHDDGYPRPLGVIDAEIARAKGRRVTLDVNASASDVAEALGAKLTWGPAFQSWTLTPRDVLATLATLERERADRVALDTQEDAA
jgi:hypothetical protein